MANLMQTDPALAIELFRRMLRIRLVEETIAARYPEQEMRCPTHLCTGQEAVAAAVCMTLRADDFAVSGHRAHGHYLAKGGDLGGMLAEIYGKRTGCSHGKGGSMHLIDRSAGFMGSTAIVGGTIPIGVGLGLSAKLHGTDQVSCVFLGDGATEEGVFYESLNFAVLKQLPVLFVCENNLYSVYSPLAVRQPAERRIWELARSIGANAEHLDGNDALAVYDAARTAVDAIRQGHGPRFLECATYRWREHCGPFFDNDLGYRAEEEFLAWKARDPVAVFESRLTSTGVLSQDQVEEMGAAIRREIDEAFEAAARAPFPGPHEAFTDLYSCSPAP